MERDKKKLQLPRAASKVKALHVSDFIALGSKSSTRVQSDSSESKASSKIALSSSSGTSSERKKDTSSSSSSVSISIKKTKLSSSGATPLGRSGAQLRKDANKGDQWDSVAMEVESFELVSKILEAEEAHDDERIEALLCGIVKKLRASRQKPDPESVYGLIFLANTRPYLFCSELTVEAFCSLLKRDGTVNFKSKSSSVIPVLSSNILMAAYREESSWPEIFVKAYIEDSLGERSWVDLEDCKGFVDNILTAFNTKPIPKSMLIQERLFKQEAACPSPPTFGTDDDEGSCSSLNLDFQDHQEIIAVFPRYRYNEESLQQYVMEVIREHMLRRQPMEISRNTLHFLASTCGLSEVRSMVTQKLEMWLQNPKLSRPAQELLLAVCLNCNQHNQQDVEVISSLVKIRIKTKPIVNHFLQCIKELLGQHPDNLSTVLKHAIYNELSSSRNPNNMQLLSVIFQHSPDRAAKVLAEVFQDLLANRDDYLRALRALLREIVRTVRNDLNFSTFCLGLFQERRDASFLDLEAPLKERVFLSIADLIVLAIFLSISPSVREAYSALTRGDKKDLTSLRQFQMQVSTVQRDALWWLYSVVPKVFKPGKNEYVHSVQKIVFLEQIEHYYNKDNWPTEGERLSFIRMASEVPVLEETLMRLLLIGLSKEHPLNAPEALEIADQLVKRAASIYVDGFTVLAVESTEIFELVFNLCRYHYPENISLPHGYYPPELAITDLYWKAWIMLLIIAAHNARTFGDIAWKSYPILRSLMEMCITNQFTFPPPTMAVGDKVEEFNQREIQLNQLEKDEILQFESHLAAASTKVTITENNSLLLSKVVHMIPCGDPRRPPTAVLEQLKNTNAMLRLGNLLCRSRNPDFLLNIIQSQGTSQSMPWLGELVESSESSFSMLPVQCLCEFLLNDAGDSSVLSDINEDRDDKGERISLKKKKKQEQLLYHLQALLHEPGSNPADTVEVIDYFMKRLSSQQAGARNLASQGLRMVLSQPNKSPESDDEDLLEKMEKASLGDHSWLLKHLPTLPHFKVVQNQACIALRQACQIESDPGAVAAYVKFLASNTPDESLQQFSDLALDMAQLIVERPTIVNTILPTDGSCNGQSNDFLTAIAEIFFRYLNKAKMPSKEIYSWSESQDHILVQWPSGESATMHILVVHAMVIVLTYGAPDGCRSYFADLLETWFPKSSEPPLAYLVDTSEEALLLPDWLKLRMIRSSVDSLVDAALKDLDPSQLVLFIQSFGIPVPSMSKLLKTLDLAVDFDSFAVEQAVVDKSYMSQLVEVQHRRGASGGEKFAQLLVDSDSTESNMESEAVPTQTHVIQRAPPKLPAATPVDSISFSVVKLFGLDPSCGFLNAKQEQEIFKGLQKALSQDILNKVSEHGALSHFIGICQQILLSDLKMNFIQALLRKSSYSSALFRVATAAQAPKEFSNSTTQGLVWICQELLRCTTGVHSPLLTIASQFINKHKTALGLKTVAPWKCYVRQNDKQSMSCEDIVKTIKLAESQDPVRLEEVVQDLVKDAILKCDTKPLVAAMTKILLETDMGSSSIRASSEGKFCLFVDWLERLEPKLIASYPEPQCQLLFSLVNNRGSSIAVPFRPYLLALLIHRAGWDTLHYCINLVLQPSSSVNNYDPTSVLDFLWACIYIPKILQGKDKKTPKHHAEEDVLALNEDQITVVVDNIVQEAVQKSVSEKVPDPSHDTAKERHKEDVNPVLLFRLHLLVRCLSNRRSLINKSVKHLLNIVVNQGPKGKMSHELLLHLYLQIPAVIACVSDQLHLLTESPFSLEQAYSKLDVISHTMLTSLAATEASKACTDRMADLDRACRKMASAHPVLLLRQMSMIATLLRGRVGFAFSIFRNRNHLTLFSCILGLLELLPPYLFKPEYTSAVHNVFESYMDMIQGYGTSKEVVPLLNRFLNLLLQYLAVRPTSARQIVQQYSDLFMELQSAYPDMGSLRSLIAGTSLPQWGSTGSLQSSSDKERESTTGAIAGAQVLSSWTPSQLAPIANRLAQSSYEDVQSALQDLDNISNRKPSILKHFLDELKKFIQDNNGTIRGLAFTLLLRHLKNNPRDAKCFISVYLQCLESEQRDVVLTALEKLPEFVVLTQEYADLLLQKAFSIGMSTNINSATQIRQTITLLNMQCGC